MSQIVRAMLLDIEGTTTPIKFVHDVLFPYARRHLTSYLEQHGHSTATLADLNCLRDEHASDVSAGKEPPPLVEPYLQWLIDRDHKSPSLKSLQGKIWEQGYRDGSLQAPIFPDVVEAMKRWRQEQITVNIFSSGSVHAQKLLFSHTDAGDLTGFIGNYFDTGVGKKTDRESYRKIAKALSLATNEIHFVSDVLSELDAAADAGMTTSLCVRPDNPAQRSSQRDPHIQSFDELFV
ncbi:MAG TPA: acireductone synthase [Pyrinomonadaceae bacterium]